MTAKPLLVVSELGNPGREPHATSVANQQHRTVAFRRCRIQRLVDAKIAIRFERNTGKGGAALDERRDGLTQQRREDALVGVLPDGIAAGQEQAAPPDLDAAIGVDVGSQIGDPPGPRAREDPSHDIQPHVRERSIQVRWPSDVRHRNDSNAASEFRQKVTLMRAELTNHPKSQ